MRKKLLYDFINYNNT
uniref:Uncharacterized protein n=1 Tax=Anguilla anguilla TaxID=7936 RepID=A0A0E9S7R5_ANGAN